MRHSPYITLVLLFFLAAHSHAKRLSKNPEVAEFQKLELIMRERHSAGLSPQDELLKAGILEIRALYVNGEVTRDEWQAREQTQNAALLKLQVEKVSQGKNSIDTVFEFQNWLLSTRELLRRHAPAGKPDAGESKQSH